MFIRPFLICALFLTFACVSGPDISCSEERCICDSGREIPEQWVCDGDNDCRDWQDEDGCPGVNIPRMDCEGDRCMCRAGREISIGWICDGDNDCGDWEDEDGCPGFESGGSSSGGSSGGSSSTGNQACWDCSSTPCILYYAPYC